MNEVRKATWWPGVLLGVLSALMLGIVGGFAPLIRSMLADSGFENNWRCRLLFPVYWAWTIPLGLGVLVGLIMAARRSSQLGGLVRGQYEKG